MTGRKDFIIIEGCDGVGKSTLVSLLKHRGYKSFHFPYDPSASIKEKYIKILSQDYKSNVVLDRSFISEMIYGPIKRGYSRLSEQDFTELLKLFRSKGGRIVLLDAPTQIIWKRLKSRKDFLEKHMTINLLGRLRNAYRHLLSTRKDAAIKIIRNDRLKPYNTLSKLHLAKMPIQCLIFDFDDTLYASNKTSITQQLKHRIATFVQNKLNISYDRALKLSHKYRAKYGSVISGLSKLYKINPKEFIDYVYDLDLSDLKKNPTLKAQLQSIPEKKVILTNADEAYVEKALKIIGIRDEFSSIIGINRTNFVSKPKAVGYEIAIKENADSGHNCIMFDDQINNLQTAKSLGMTTVLCNHTTNTNVVKGINYIAKDLNKDLLNIIEKIRSER